MRRQYYEIGEYGQRRVGKVRNVLLNVRDGNIPGWLVLAIWPPVWGLVIGTLYALHIKGYI